MNTIAIQKLPLTMPCSISFSHLSKKFQKSLGRPMKEDIEIEDTTVIFHKSKKSREQSTEVSDEPSRMQLIEPSKEQMEPVTESSEHG